MHYIKYNEKYTVLKSLTFLVLDPFSVNSVLINPRYIEQNSVVPSELVIMRFHCNNECFFVDHASAISVFYGYDITESWIMEYSGSIKGLLVGNTSLIDRDRLCFYPPSIYAN